MKTTTSEASEAGKQSAFENTHSNNCHGCHVKGARICHCRGGEEDGIVKVFQMDRDCESSAAPDYEYVFSPTALHHVSDLIFDIQKVRRADRPDDPAVSGHLLR